jgi:hypothetical protein
MHFLRVGVTIEETRRQHTYIHITENFRSIAEASPTIVSYNASAVKIYKVTGSLVRFEDENIFIYVEKTLYPTMYNASAVVVNLGIICRIGSWGRCYDHNFRRFSPIFGEKIGVFLKNQCYDHNFCKN